MYQSEQGSKFERSAKLTLLKLPFDKHQKLLDFLRGLLQVVFGGRVNAHSKVQSPDPEVFPFYR